MPINKQSKVNNLITWLHLWLGLITGIVVVIVSLTGCLFAFQQEISNWVYKEKYFVQPPAGMTQVMPLSRLKASAQKALGADKAITYITTYSNPERAWEFMAYKTGDLDALTFPGEVDYYESAFVNPYTGEVTGTLNYMTEFFTIVKYIHWSLYLSTKYGQPIVGWSTLLFVVSLITGFIMWVPKRWNKIEKDKAFKVRWKARFKRLNYDLHNVLGFYTVAIAFILAITGLFYAFRWMEKALYTTFAWSTAAPAYPTFVSDSSQQAAAAPLDIAFNTAVAAFPGGSRYGLSLPLATTSPVRISAYYQKEVYFNYDVGYYDQYSGKTLGHSLYQDKNNGEKFIDMDYDIHIGAVGGLAGKIIAFLVSLVCASLPITGFIIWWGKKKKRKTPAPYARSPKRQQKATGSVRT